MSKLSEQEEARLSHLLAKKEDSTIDAWMIQLDETIQQHEIEASQHADLIKHEQERHEKFVLEENARYQDHLERIEDIRDRYHEIAKRSGHQDSLVLRTQIVNDIAAEEVAEEAAPVEEIPVDIPASDANPEQVDDTTAFVSTFLEENPVEEESAKPSKKKKAGISVS